MSNDLSARGLFRGAFAAWLPGLLLLVAFMGPLHAALNPEDLLEPEKAFRFSAQAVGGGEVEVRFRIAPGYYLYRDRFKFEAEPAATLTPQFPTGLPHDDKFFGRQEIYRGDLAIRLAAKDAERFKLTVTSQGCADVGVCYVPQRQSAQIVLAGAGGTAGGTGPRSLREQLNEMSAPAPVAESPGLLSGRLTDLDVSRLLQEGSFWLVLGSFFVFGLLLAFTPCVLPMLPILSGIIVGEGGTGRRRALLLSLSYVLGMATAYAALGVAAGWSGALLSVALQNAWVLGGFALVFVVLALSMFGLYELQLPGWLHNRLHTAGARLSGGQLLSVGVMGLLSAVIVSPCVAAPLAGALLYLSQSGDVMLGGSALFVMALGMGVPLVAVGVSEGALLPRSGPWMTRVRQLFGVLLLAVAVWIASPLLPVAALMTGWAILLTIAAVLLGAVDRLPAGAGLARRIAKAGGLLTLVAGLAMFTGVLTGSRDPLRPLDGLLGNAGVQASPVHFERIRSLGELEQKVAAAGRPVMLDFYADWCVTCKEMERYTFTDSRVQGRLSNVLLLQADVTENTADDQALLKRFRLFGPPGIVFFDALGKEIPGLRVIGYQAPESFLKSLERLP